MCCDSCCTFECDREHVDDPEYSTYVPDAHDVRRLITDVVERLDLARYGVMVTHDRPDSVDARIGAWRRALTETLVHEVVGEFIESR